MNSLTDFPVRPLDEAVAGIEQAVRLADPASHQPPPGLAEFLKRAKIMIVNDEPLMIEIVREYLRCDGYQRCISTENSLHALSIVHGEKPDLVLLDVQMPQIDGLAVLEEIRQDPSLARVAVIMLTAATDSDLKLRALQLGAQDFLHKPINAGELLARLRNTLLAKAYQDQLRNQADALEAAVRQRTAELEESRREVIHCLARAAEFRDDDTGHHVVRVGRYARVIAEQLGFSADQLDVLEMAAQLHDIGKIGIPDAVLLKPGKLTPEEFDLMQKHCGFGKRIIERMPDDQSRQLRSHTELGAQMLDAGRSPILKLALQIALTHHERWNGSGYPLGLAGEDIPLESRITAVADVFDALSSKRPYKPALPLDKCVAIMEEGRGAHFDPRVLDAFLARRDTIVEIQIAHADTA